MVLIKELLPNPAGKDTDGEWITLLNDGEVPVNLQGWFLTDTSGKKFIFGDQAISPNGELKLPYSLTRIALNNDGDTVTLWDANSAKADELSYGQVSEEEVIVSSKTAPPVGEQLTASPLAASEFAGTKISPEEISPLLIALGLALAFGIVAFFLTKKLLES